MKIFGYNYKVDRERPVFEIGVMGRFHAETLTIQIANNLAQEQQVSTMLHEIIEAILYHTELKVDHNVVSTLETGLYQILTDNGVDLSPLEKVE